MPTLTEDRSQAHLCSRKAARETRFSLLLFTDPSFLSIPTCLVMGGTSTSKSSHLLGDQVGKSQEKDGKEGLTESSVLQAQWPWAHGPPPLHTRIFLLRVHHETLPPQQHPALTAYTTSLWVSQCLEFGNSQVLDEILEFTLEKRCISAETRKLSCGTTTIIP